MKPLSKNLCLSAAISLTACSVSNERSKTFKLVEGDVTREIIEGFKGCEWKGHKFKTRAPLKGKMTLNILDCPIDKKYEPAFGYKTIYFLNSDNELMLKSRPFDPKYPHTKQPSGPFLKLHKLEGYPEAFMQKFVNKTQNPNCTIRENSNGVWQIGYEKTFLESQGYSFPYFDETCPSDAFKNYKEKSRPCLKEEQFPLQISGICSFDENYGSEFKFRISGPVIVEYHRELFEPHPEDQALLDISSIEFTQ